MLAADDWSAQCYADNAVACRRSGRFEIGNQLTTAALALRGQALGHTADVALLLEHARARRELGDLPAADESLAKAREILTERAAAEPRLRGEVLLEQGSLARHREFWSDAQQLLREAAADLAPLDDCLPLHARALYEYGCALRGGELLTEAVAPLEEALSYRQALGSDYPDLVGGGRLRVGMSLRIARSANRRTACIEQAADLQIALTGPDHWAMAMVLVEQATTCETLGRWAEAAELLHRAATIQLVHYGSEHPNIRQTWAHLGANMVARACQARGRSEQPGRRPVLADHRNPAADGCRRDGRPQRDSSWARCCANLAGPPRPSVTWLKRPNCSVAFSGRLAWECRHCVGGTSRGLPRTQTVAGS